MNALKKLSVWCVCMYAMVCALTVMWGVCVCVFLCSACEWRLFILVLRFCPINFLVSEATANYFYMENKKKIHDHSHQKVEAEQKKVAPRRPNKTITIQPLKCVSSIHTENKKWFYWWISSSNTANIFIVLHWAMTSRCPWH